MKENFRMEFILILVAIFLPTMACMSAVAFRDLNDWPEGGLTDGRIWDIGAAWNQIHTGVDVYDWGLLDQVVNQYEIKNIKMTYVISACPLWLAKYPDNPNYAPWLGPGSNSMPSDIDEFNKFVWNLSTRYAGRISTYEIWNEPQLADFLYPYNDEELDTLANMTKRAYNTIKSCDSSAKVLSASMLPRASSGGMSKAGKYLTALQNYGWNIDAFNTHIYPENGEGADTWKAMLSDAQTSIASYSPPTGEVWVTETLYNLNGPVIPEDEASSLVDDTYSAAASLGVSQIFWYCWDDYDLGGLQINAGSTAWAAIQSHV